MSECDCPSPNVFNETRYQWTWDAFATCAYTPAQAAGMFIGFMSIGFWILAQMPQLYENYRNKSASALSVGFLVFWTLGDSSNLVGCVLLDLDPTQLYTAIYFCFVDSMLWSQYLYYTFFYPRVAGLKEENPEEEKLINETETKAPEGYGGDPMAAFVAKQNEPSKKRVSRRGSYLYGIVLLGVSLTLLSFMSQTTKMTNANEFSKGSMRSLLSDVAGGIEDCKDDPVDPSTEIAGLVIAWLCAALYLSSRLPQIFLNWRRGSVQGLSIHLFIFAVMGNLTYVLSILLQSSSTYEIVDNIPYLVGSGGTLVFDFTIFVQFKLYSVKKVEDGYTTIGEPV